MFGHSSSLTLKRRSTENKFISRKPNECLSLVTSFQTIKFAKTHKMFAGASEYLYFFATTRFQTVFLIVYHRHKS